YRLNVLALRIPPLRERGEDLVELTRYLVTSHAAQLGRPVPEISESALQCIRNYPWPGNVRELENALARAVAMSQRAVLLPGDLPPIVVGEPSASERVVIDHDWPTLDTLQRRYVERVVER